MMRLGTIAEEEQPEADLTRIIRVEDCEDD
jgi:hypothetical protein